ncbi:thiol-disulfide oxidoreductase [Leptolyngbya sp. 'hensonii']|uniref:thiol-disulfide oxidoreductase DCC family protein n=1 Tax=Leptolyngbya sp. 'hensonii' TaxID=1922337 RepID=UPI00094FCD9F|nr:DCC1-like thiol-disulfide oxidoreductase family protein [Leptolyngbya sp. 'hensonii']OLP16137.1 thiol-disulfide oxidoreductase [Leptolyngbya sp. 'hensonii']
MTYLVIYDGNCNLCTTLVQLLQALDRGQQFQYLPMQNPQDLAAWNVTPADCELGMILINVASPDRRWQGSAAAEEIGRLLPLGEVFIPAYRSLPGLKETVDRLYEYVRDHRYTLFGKRPTTYQSSYPACGCDLDSISAESRSADGPAPQ